GCRTCAPRCSACSATTTSTRRRPRSTSWTSCSPSSARSTSSTATTTPGTRSSRPTGRPTVCTRPCTATVASATSSPVISAARRRAVRTSTTEQAPIEGSGKGRDGWFTLRTATVYYDHPVHAPADHTLNIDFADPDAGPAARVAVELTAESALALVDAIRAALAAVPPELTNVAPERLRDMPGRQLSA